MPTIEEMKESRAGLLGQAGAIRTSAQTLNREATDEELDKIESLIGEADTLETSIDTLQRRADTLNRLDEKVADLRRPDKPQTLQNGVVDGHQGTASVRPRLEDDPNRGYETPRAFMLDVIQAGQHPLVPLSDGLQTLRAAVGSDEGATFSDPAGGFLIPEGFSPKLLELRPEDDPTASRVTALPMATPTVKIPALVDKVHTSSVSGGFTVSRREEAGSATSSKASFELITLSAASLFGLAYATEEILNDSPITFAAIIAGGFRKEIGGHLYNERLNGTGTGEFLGIMNSAALISVAKEGSQSADTIVPENIWKMRSRCYDYQNAIWLTNHDCYPQLASMGFDISSGNSPIWQESMGPDRPSQLLGRPIFFSEYPETLGDEGDLILASFSHYIEGTYQGLMSAESIHVRFVEHERAFKFWLRNDGRPWWTSALTPKKGANTLSPFVTLAERAA